MKYKIQAPSALGSAGLARGVGGPLQVLLKCAWPSPDMTAGYLGNYICRYLRIRHTGNLVFISNSSTFRSYGINIGIRGKNLIVQSGTESNILYVFLPFSITYVHKWLATGGFVPR